MSGEGIATDADRKRWLTQLTNDKDRALRQHLLSLQPSAPEPATDRTDINPEAPSRPGRLKRTRSISSSLDSKDDDDVAAKRRRNNEASARFRSRKRDKERELKEEDKRLREGIRDTERQVALLQEEQKWLRDLLREKVTSSRRSTISSALPPPPLPPRLNPVQGPPPALPPRNPQRGASTPPLPTPAAAPPAPLAPGLSDDALNTLLRRWNTSIDHLKTTTVQPGRLDLNPSLDATFSPEKLRSNVERLYLSVIKNLIAFGKEIVALRSWEDPLRTGTFCSTYFIAWSSPLGVGALLLAFIATLVLHPPARATLFPPRPPKLDAPAGPGIPGGDPLTPIDREGLTAGEREELEAREFAQDFADLAAAPFEHDLEQTPTVKEIVTEVVTTGVHGEPGEEGTVGGEGEAAPKVEDATTATSTKVEKKKTKVLKKHGLPIQIITGELADAWERWSNLLEPTTPPFEAHRPRAKVALHLLPIALAFLLLPVAFIVYTLTFAMGFLFFGDPILQRIPTVIDALTNVDWREALQIRYSVLNGVPTNTQLTVALLREAELAGTPLPPPPALPSPLPTRPTPSRKSTTSSLISNSETASLAGSDVESFVDEDDNASVATGSTHKQSGKANFGAFIKATARLTETTAGYTSGQKKVNWQKYSRIAVDKLKAATNSELPERFMKHVPPAPPEDNSHSIFYAHRNSAPGHIILHPPSPSTDFSWTLEFLRVGKVPPMDSSQASITIPMADVTELKRTGGLGWKGRMAAGWMLDAKGSVGNGLDVNFGEGEAATKVKFSGIVRRDQLFNRLAGIAPHNLCHL